jgi:NhaP-type Na+/H+ or K+/H+ antiporter
MFQKVISTKGFWRSVVSLAIGFIFIYNIIDIWFGYDFDWSLYAENRFAKDNLLRFFVANIMSGVVYGFVVTFLKFRGNIKKNKSQ